MNKELKLGMLVIGENSIYRQEGRIDDICESTGTRKGKLYRVGINYFFEDEIIPMEFNNSPRWYYDIVIKMKEDLFYAIKEYGYTLKNGTMRYNFRQKGLYPCVEFGAEKIKIKRITVTPHDIITITTDDNRQLDATYDYNVHLWCYWHIYDDIEKKKKKNR
jgi:hypothetical protein